MATHRTRPFVLAAAVLLFGGADAAAQEAAAPAPSPWPPPYQDRRFEENWRPPDWTNPHAGARDLFDNVKALKLTDSGSVWVGFGGQARGRLARQSTVTYGGPFDFEPTMWTWRLRAHADLHFGENYRVFGEGIYSHTTIDENRLGEFNNAPNLNGDVLNLFGEYRRDMGTDWQLGLWGGRRELQMGHERILSPGNWLLNRHTFDGAGGWLSKGNQRLEGFFVRPRIPVPDMFHTRDDETEFWGLFYTTTQTRTPTLVFGDIRVPGRQQRVVLQPYVLHTDRDDVLSVQQTADEDRYTFGMLTYGDVGQTGLDFEVESAYQYGRWQTPFEDGIIHAYMVTTEVGYRFTRTRYFPRAILSFDYASGDSDATDDKLETFDPLYPLAYVFFGFHAAFERRNLIMPGAHLEAVLARNLYFRTNYFPAMMRADVNDGIYDSFQNIVRRPEPQSRGGDEPDLQRASRNFGQQWDFGIAWIPTHHLLFYGTYLRFWAGDFIRQTQTAPPDSMNGVMVLTQFTF